MAIELTTCASKCQAREQGREREADNSGELQRPSLNVQAAVTTA